MDRFLQYFFDGISSGAVYALLALSLVVVFLVRIPAWVFLGGWFLLQLFEGNFGLFSASANGGGTAFFAHIGGFLFGLFVARVFAGAVAREPATAAS